MIIEFTKNNTVLSDFTDFDLKQTFTCGQCFRWEVLPDGSYQGIAWGKLLKISQDETSFTLHNVSQQEYIDIWEKYFDIGRDYSAIKQSLAISDTMKKSIAAGSGIRILRQDIWETILSFIISASNNIPRIKKIIASLCENFGEPIENGFYSFPSPDKLKGITVEELAPIKAGFRAKYIVDAVNKANSGEVNIYSLESLDTASARKELLKINGVGNKVADCILLFSLGRTEVFPVDVWIKNTMCALYPEKCSSVADARSVGPEIFGENCGIAQQYLFYYARENGGNI
ncbi:MAG: DNA glycosylase [Clostridia bacterium]|nr:DNA glycosylase [Clostridia bacterium]